MIQIPVTSIANLQIGQAQDAAAGTGCTVILCPAGMAAGLDVRGGGPASRESELLRPVPAAASWAWPICKLAMEVTGIWIIGRPPVL